MTKREHFEDINRKYNKSEAISVYEVYKNPSAEKVNAERAIMSEMYRESGFDYRVISHNVFQFTAAYQYMDRETGVIKLRVHTSRTVYEIDFMDGDE